MSTDVASLPGKCAPSEREALQTCYDALMKFAKQAFDAPPPWSDLTIAVEAAREALAARSPAPSAGVDGWVSVANGLPPADTMVQVRIAGGMNGESLAIGESTHKSGTRDVREWTITSGGLYRYWGRQCDGGTVTHWRKLAPFSTPAAPSVSPAVAGDGFDFEAAYWRAYGAIHSLRDAANNDERHGQVSTKHMLQAFFGDTTPPPAPAAEQGEPSYSFGPHRESIVYADMSHDPGYWAQPEARGVEGRIAEDVMFGWRLARSKVAEKDARSIAERMQRQAATPNPVRAEQPEGKGEAYGIIDPDYARVFTIARCLAWAEGYSLAMQGSFTRDLDLLAVPWTDAACEPEHLARRIEDAAGLRITVPLTADKPHGRMAATMKFKTFGDPRFVDLSIMPRIAALTAALGQQGDGNGK